MHSGYYPNFFRDYLTFNERQNLIAEKFVKTNHVHDRGLMRKHDDPISLKKKRNEARKRRIGVFAQRKVLTNSGLMKLQNIF